MNPGYELCRFPRSEILAIADALISILQVKDQRYNLSFYGNFFHDIPKRLGYNLALDTSVKAIITALPFHHTRVLPAGALAHYVDSLKATRITLNDSVKGRTSDTLCAMYLVLVCSVRETSGLLLRDEY